MLDSDWSVMTRDVVYATFVLLFSPDVGEMCCDIEYLASIVLSLLSDFLTGVT